MILDKIIVNNGKVLRTENILENGDQWEFINNDPQIIVRFDTPVKGISITFNTMNTEDKILNTIVYYREDNINYDEEKKIVFNLSLSQESVHEIYFFKEITEIRLDLHDRNEIISINDIEIKLLENNVDQLSCLKKNFGISNYSQKEKVVLLSHDLSGTGAPILAFNIAKSLKKSGIDVVVLVGNYIISFLKQKYQDENIPLVFLSDSTYNHYNVHICSNYNEVKSYDGDEYVKLIFELLREEGYSNVITNTVVGGRYVKEFKDFNFKIISLIHEMGTTIRLYGFYEFGRNIAKYADYIVFPDETVKNDFFSIYSNVRGQYIIRPQGIYLDKKIDVVDNIDFSTKYGFKLGDYIIMNSGTCELRKGIDLFISSAIILAKQSDLNIHFVWTGNFGNNNELEGWIINQIEKSGLQTNIHIIPFIQDQNEYKTLLSNVDIFWSTSREDPFPSVVLEALNYDITVVGFKDGGGINTMLDDNRGFLIDDFNVFELAKISNKILKGEINRPDKNGITNFLNTLNFNDYVEFLINKFNDSQIIYPVLDLYKWNRVSKKHYYQLQLPYKTTEEKMQQLNNALNQKKGGRKRVIYKNEIVLLNTAIGTDNVSDEIIMNYCEQVCEDVLDNDFLHIPTHIYDKKSEHLDDYFKILCGTNLIYKRMEDSRQFSIPDNLTSYQNICLLGVGMQQIGIENDMSEYSKQLLKYMLSSKIIHSVRDNETKEELMKIGINNVLNTGCPTMWNLTVDHCKKIPTKKASNVITTVTDYMQDSENDYRMLKILKENYNKVFIWIQGQYDYEYLETIVDLNDYEVIPPSLSELDKYLAREDVDYIGTRLHAGIRSLNYLNRSLIIAIDNRARAISMDTHLPTMERCDIESKLIDWIYSEYTTEIVLPVDAIEEWKGQFKKIETETNFLKKNKFPFKAK